MTSAADKQSFINKNCDPQLAFLFSNEELSIDSQYTLVSKGLKSIRKFAVLEDDKPGVRQACKDVLKMTDAIEISLVASSWETANIMRQEEDKVRATSAASNLTRPVTSIEYEQMKKALSARQGGNKIPEAELTTLADCVDSVGKRDTKWKWQDTYRDEH